MPRSQCVGTVFAGGAVVSPSAPPGCRLLPCKMRGLEMVLEVPPALTCHDALFDFLSQRWWLSSGWEGSEPWPANYQMNLAASVTNEGVDCKAGKNPAQGLIWLMAFEKRALEMRDVICVKIRRSLAENPVRWVLMGSSFIWCCPSLLWKASKQTVWQKKKSTEYPRIMLQLQLQIIYTMEYQKKENKDRNISNVWNNDWQFTQVNVRYQNTNPGS